MGAAISQKQVMAEIYNDLIVDLIKQSVIACAKLDELRFKEDVEDELACLGASVKAILEFRQSEG
jgi:hypothetical protein